MKEQRLNNTITHYPVRVWEILLIVTGALALVSTALIALTSKVLNNMFDPARAEAVAQSLFDYQIPGGEIGVVGVNLGAKKFAIVNSNTNPPDVILFVSKVPIEQIKEENSSSIDVVFQEVFQGNFTPYASKIENKQLCDQRVAVSIYSGKRSLENQNTSVTATKYVAKVTDNGVERNVNILATGQDSEIKAAEVFDSLQCRF